VIEAWTIAAAKAHSRRVEHPRPPKPPLSKASAAQINPSVAPAGHPFSRGSWSRC